MVHMDTRVVDHIMSGIDIMFHGVVNALNEAIDQGEMTCPEGTDLGQLACEFILQEVEDHGLEVVKSKGYRGIYGPKCAVHVVRTTT